MKKDGSPTIDDYKLDGRVYEVTCNIINGIYSDFLHVSSIQVCKTSRIHGYDCGVYYFSNSS